MRNRVDAKGRRKEEGPKTGATQCVVEKLLSNTEGTAGMLHYITEPRPWRAEAQVVEDVLENAQLLTRVEVKKGRNGENTGSWMHQSK